MPPQGQELRKAAQKNNVEEITAQLENGVNIDAADANGDTALLLAAERGSVLACSALLLNGANIAHKNNDDRTASDLAREYNQTSLVPLLEAHEQIGRLVAENTALKAASEEAQGELAALSAQAESSAAELKAQLKADKKLRADIARCASATLQLVGHLATKGEGKGDGAEAAL